MAQSETEEMYFNKEVYRTVTFGYLLQFPADYDAGNSEGYPLLLFLHGSGERGTNLELVEKQGPPKVARDMDLPFIIVSPQCPEDTWWDVDDLKVLVDEIVAAYPIDPSRLYITGLSMGGYGTWEMLMKYPNLFAAAIPVCGGGYAARARLIRDIPIWAFHGQKDEVVPIDNSQRIVDALKKLDADITFTIYPEAGHDAWTETYQNPDIYTWLLKHSKTKH
jgi:predicted peptidase